MSTETTMLATMQDRPDWTWSFKLDLPLALKFEQQFIERGVLLPNDLEAHCNAVIHFIKGNDAIRGDASFEWFAKAALTGIWNATFQQQGRTWDTVHGTLEIRFMTLDRIATYDLLEHDGNGTTTEH